MKPLDIYVSHNAARAFKRRAVAAFHQNKEYMEVVFLRRGVGEFHIDRFIRVNIVEARDVIVRCDLEQYNQLKQQAKDEGLEFATIHTHIYGDSAPSKHDFTEGVAEGEVLVGVCHIWKEKSGKVFSQIDFWQPFLPCTMKIVKAV